MKSNFYSKYLCESGKDIEFSIEDLNLYINLIEYGYVIGFNDDEKAEEYFLEEQNYKVVDFIEKKIKSEITDIEAENIDRIELTYLSASVNIADEDKYYYEFKRVDFNVVFKDGSIEKEKIHPFTSELIKDDLLKYFS